MPRRSPKVCLIPSWWTVEEVQNRTCGDGSHTHIIRCDAEELVELHEAEWVFGDRVIRRLNFRKNMRGKSAKLGGELAKCIRQKKDWALAMEAQIQKRIELPQQSEQP